MSIFPSTDIVSDVARAANPLKARLAMRRLDEAALPGTTNQAAFVSTMKLSNAPTLAESRPIAGTRTDILATDRSSEPRPAARAAQKFEAFILQIWLEALLPKEGGGAFGSDSAGGVWRSMMAEQLGSQLAGAGGIGLQKLIGERDAASATASA